MPLSTQSAPADLTQHPIVETLTSEGWTYNEADSCPKCWLTFERKAKSGILFEIQFFLDGCFASYYIKGAEYGSPYDPLGTVLEEVNKAVEDNILFGGWA